MTERELLDLCALLRAYRDDPATLPADQKAARVILADARDRIRTKAKAS